MEDRRILSAEDHDLRKHVDLIAQEFYDGFRAVEQIDRPAVSIFGSARVREGSPVYESARKSARLRAHSRRLPQARRIAGPVAGLVLPLLLTAVLTHTRGVFNLTSQALLFLITVMGVARRAQAARRSSAA